MIFSKPHKNEPEAMQMEKTKREEGQKTGRWARWISRAYFVARAGCRGADRRTCCPGAVETVRDVLGLEKEAGRARPLQSSGCAVRWGERCGGVRRVVSGALPVKRLDLAPGFAAALCLLRLLAEPRVYAFLAAAAAHEAGHVMAIYLVGER